MHIPNRLLPSPLPYNIRCKIATLKPLTWTLHHCIHNFIQSFNWLWQHFLANECLEKKVVQSFHSHLRPQVVQFMIQWPILNPFQQIMTVFSTPIQWEFCIKDTSPPKEDCSRQTAATTTSLWKIIHAYLRSKTRLVLSDGLPYADRGWIRK